MAAEIAECPRVAEDAVRASPALRRLAAAFQKAPPPVVVLCGRGSSGHAGLYLRYLIETRLRVPVSMAAPSIASAYRARMRMDRAWFIVLSQSGASPDLVESAMAARSAGALTVGLLNEADSRVGDVVETAIPLCAGRETSVAATKSVLATMAAGARLVAEIAGDHSLHGALDRLPQRVSRALECDWSPLAQELSGQREVYTIGRGLGLAVAKEVALKLAEVLRIPAHAYSAAEILHGPRAAIADGSLVLAFEVEDETARSVRQTTQALESGGARTLSCGGGSLAWIGAEHPATDAIAMLAPAWSCIEMQASAMGFDPDRPPFLNKVTKTL